MAITRGFRRRAESVGEARLPPGQYDARDSWEQRFEGNG